MGIRVDMDDLSRAAQRMACHANELGKITDSLKEDRQVFFQPHNGPDPYEAKYDRCIGMLSEAIQFLKGFSEKASAVVEAYETGLFDESI